LSIRPGVDPSGDPLDAPRKSSFPPVVDGRSRLLVLGTLPGEESLRRQEYYAHPRNLFWPIAFALFDASPSERYEERLGFVLQRGIALWDVCGSAERVASADTAIRAEMPNAIPELLQSHPAIRAVAFNGTAARRLYDRHFTPRPDLTYFALPSTSPAHARLGLAEKLAEWNALRRFLEDGRT
jgi:TDG/mug DNA glycosylase family protein